MARSKGSATKGYFYRGGRGWVAGDNQSYVLRDEAGNRLTDKRTPTTTIDRAFIRYKVAMESEAKAKPADENPISVLDIARQFLDYTHGHSSPGTYSIRQDDIFDFVTGLPARWKNASEKQISAAKQAGELKKIHDGYGMRLATGIRKIDIINWCAAHPNWTDTGGQRRAKTAVRRMFNWAKEMGLIEANPIAGIEIKAARSRDTYYERDRLKQMYENAKPHLRLAMEVMVKTGARPYCEFCALTAKHVVNFEGKQKWVWPNGSKVRGKQRVIYVQDAELIALVNDLCKQHPSGPIFRNSIGKPWCEESLKSAFDRLRTKLKNQGMEFDPDDAVYSFRHTYAKQQYERGISTEKLAMRMGNSVQEAAKYSRWCDRNEELAWED